jgi:cytochrome P450
VIASDVDLSSPAAVADPYPSFDLLRSTGPVVWLPAHRAWFFSTHDVVSDGFHDPRLSSDRLTPLESRVDDQRRQVLAQTFELLRGWMVFHDEPDHARLREPLKRAFTPRRVEGLRHRVAALVDELLTGIDTGAPVDLVERFAFPLPAIVIAELLGVPPADRDRFKTWSDKLAGIVFGASGDARAAEVVASGSTEFADYFGWLVRRYTDHPADNLVSALIAASRPGDGDRPGLSPTELVGACTLLLFGGHETTTNLIGNSVLALLRHPDQLAALRSRPEAVATAVEELNRYDGSTKVMVRIVAEDHHRAGHALQAGQTVLLGVASANRDPAAFGPDADAVRLDRAEAHRHLGFGFGSHYCLGAHLARLEVHLALSGVVRRFPRLALSEDGPLSWQPTLISRGLERLPVTCS